MSIRISTTHLKEGPFFTVNIQINKVLHRFEINDPNARVDDQMNEFMTLLQNQELCNLHLELDDENVINTPNGWISASYLKIEYHGNNLSLISAYDGKALLSKFHITSQSDYNKLVQDIQYIFAEINKVRSNIYEMCVQSTVENATE